MSLNISDFNLYVTIAPPPPWKKSPPLSQQPPSKSWGPVKPPLFLNLVVGSTLPPCRNGGREGAHYVTLTETDELRLQSQVRLLLTAYPELLNSRVALYFPCNLNHPLKFDWETGRQERQTDQKTSMLVVVTYLKHLISNIN